MNSSKWSEAAGEEGLITLDKNDVVLLPRLKKKIVELEILHLGELPISHSILPGRQYRL